MSDSNGMRIAASVSAPAVRCCACNISPGRSTTGMLGAFPIVFLWQFPHFMAIAWMYREDYDRAD
jgi:heme O synthase-like polyprenyltransferase